MVLQLVFKTLKWKLKEVMVTGTINSTWYTVACSELRSRYGDSPILRLWNTEVSKINCEYQYKYLYKWRFKLTICFAVLEKTLSVLRIRAAFS